MPTSFRHIFFFVCCLQATTAQFGEFRQGYPTCERCAWSTSYNSSDAPTQTACEHLCLENPLCGYMTYVPNWGVACYLHDHCADLVFTPIEGSVTVNMKECKSVLEEGVALSCDICDWEEHLSSTEVRTQVACENRCRTTEQCGWWNYISDSAISCHLMNHCATLIKRHDVPNSVSANLKECIEDFHCPIHGDYGEFTIQTTGHLITGFFREPSMRPNFHGVLRSNCAGEITFPDTEKIVPFYFDNSQCLINIGGTAHRSTHPDCDCRWFQFYTQPQARSCNLFRCTYLGGCCSGHQGTPHCYYNELKPVCHEDFENSVFNATFASFLSARVSLTSILDIAEGRVPGWSPDNPNVQRLTATEARQIVATIRRSGTPGLATAPTSQVQVEVWHGNRMPSTAFHDTTGAQPDPNGSHITVRYGRTYHLYAAFNGTEVLSPLFETHITRLHACHGFWTYFG